MLELFKTVRRLQDDLLARHPDAVITRVDIGYYRSEVDLFDCETGLTQRWVLTATLGRYQAYLERSW